MKEESFNIFQTAQQQLGRIINFLGLPNGTWNLLRFPVREYKFVIQVRMTDGSMGVFHGYRIHHNDARGPCAGGIRFHPQATPDFIRAMAMWMTWKSAVVDLPLGGASGCVVCDPHHLSIGEQEQVCRGWIRHLSRNIGPIIDIPAPDIMTNSQHMLWMMDEYENIHGAKYPGVITGKPIGMGGCQGRIEAPGYGVVFSLREAMKVLNIEPDSTTASIQGFGNVAQNTAVLFEQIGGKIICVACWNQSDQIAYSYRKRDGINISELRSITNHFGEINKEKAQDLDYEVLPGDAWLEQEVDVLIPAAFENQINQDNVNSINPTVKIIAEAANGPTTPEADEIIKKKGIFLIPDCLANAGGIICSYFEQVQNNMNYYWAKDEVLSKLDTTLTTAFLSVADAANRRKLAMREAAQIIAVERVAQSCRDRGWL